MSCGGKLDFSYPNNELYQQFCAQVGWWKDEEWWYPFEDSFWEDD